MVEGLEQGGARRALIRSLFDGMAEPLGARMAEATALRQAFMEELAAAVAPALNAEAGRRPQERLTDKQDLATTLNAVLHAAGLCLRCPRTGQPAILAADLKDAEHAAVSRFRFESRDDRGRKVRAGAYRTLPDLEPMPDPPRREGMARDARLSRPPADDAGPSR